MQKPAKQTQFTLKIVEINFVVVPQKQIVGRSEYYQLYITETQMLNDYVRFTEFEQKFKNAFVHTLQKIKKKKKTIIK